MNINKRVLSIKKELVTLPPIYDINYIFWNKCVDLTLHFHSISIEELHDIS